MTSGHGIEDSNYAGVGIVRHSPDARYSAHDQDDVQSVVTPLLSGSSRASRFSSSNAYEADDMQQRQVPQDLSSVSSSAYRSSAARHDEDELQRTVGYGHQPVSGGSASRLYSQTREEGTSDSARVGQLVPVSGATQSSYRSLSSNFGSELTETRKPVPTGQYVSISSRPGTSNILAVPVRVIPVQGIPDEHQKYYVRTSEHSSGAESSGTRVQNPTSTTYRVTYTPAGNYISSDKIASTSETERSMAGSYQQPEKLTSYNSYNAPESASHTKFRSEDSHLDQTQTRVTPASVSHPYNGGSSRSASTSSQQQQGYTQSRVDPGFSENTIDSSSSASSTVAEKDQMRVVSSSRPTYVVSGRTSGSDQQAASYRGSSGSTYYVPVSGRTQTQHQLGSASQIQQQRQGGFSGNFSPYVQSRTQSQDSQHEAIISDRLNQRFGSGVHTSNDDLRSYMTESERLARLQQQQVTGSSRNVGIANSDANHHTLQTASNLDSAAASFVRSSDLANRNSEFDSSNGDVTGGYNRVRSWNKQSKWSSGN